MERPQTEPLTTEEPPVHAAETSIFATRVLDPVAPVTRMLETSYLEPEAWPLHALASSPARRIPVPPVRPVAAGADTAGADAKVGADADASSAAAPGTTAPPSATIHAAPHAKASAAAPGHVPVVGDLLRGRYQLRRLLGQGGTGTVFEAHDAWRLQPPEGDPCVALKVLRAEVARRGPRFTAFQREFQHLQSLSHPNIVRVHDFDRDGELAFFTMEYLSGAQLGELLAQRHGQALPYPWALAVLRDVGGAVAHAHSRNVVHGDLNPANILVTAGGQVRVLDFGASNQRQSEPWISAPDDPPRVATRPWASCEVLERAVPMPGDDVFSLACLAYQLFTGRHPFGERSALQARSMKLRPRRPAGLNSNTWWALRAGLNLERGQRPGDAAEWLALFDFKDAAATLPPLARLLLRERPPRRWWRWALGAAAAAALLAVSWWAGVHADARWSPVRVSATAPGVPHRP